MATLFQVTNEARTTIVDLWDGTLQLVSSSWRTSDARDVGQYLYEMFGSRLTFDQFEPVIESFQLVGADTRANLRAAIAAMQVAVEGARDFRADPLGYESWWFEWNVDGETAKRAFINRIALDFPPMTGIDPLMSKGAHTLLNVALERHPFYEPLSASNLSDTDVSILGGQVAVSSIAGNVPARIDDLEITGNTGGGGGADLDKFWLGFRPEYEGKTNFNSLWELEDGGAGTDVAPAVDATASDGNKMLCTFATETDWENRVSISVSQVATANGHSDYDHFVGRYLVLLRCKLTAVGTVGLRLRAGFSQSAAMQNEDQYVTDDVAWHLVELGEIQIPPWSGLADFVDGDVIRGFTMWLDAAQISGTPSLDLDCLILIPAGHMARVSNAAVVAITGSDVHLRILPDERRAGYSVNSSGIVDDSLAFVPSGFYIPAGNGVLVLAADQLTGMTLSATVDVSVDYRPRWRSYR